LLDLEFDLLVTSHQPGDWFAIDLALAAVPEPGSAALLLASVLLLAPAGCRRRRTRQATRLMAEIGRT
jgi:hypothetical protein